MRKVICKPEKGNDGWWRVTIDIYYSPRPIINLGEILNDATGLEWKFFGAFMDTACFATKSKPPEKITIRIPWQE